MEKQINLTCKRAERKYELVDWNEFIYVKGYEVYNGDTPVCFISKDDTIDNWGATTFDDYENCEGLIWGDTKKELLANIERLLRQGTLYLTQDEREAKRKAEREQDERNHNAIVEYRKAKAELEAKEVEETITYSQFVSELAKAENDSNDYAKEVAELEAKEVAEELTQSQLEAINHVWKSFDKYQENNQEVISLENTWVEDDEVDELEAKEVAEWGWKEHIENWKRAEVAEAELKAKEDEVKEAKSDEACKLFNELDDDGLVDTKHYDEALCQKQNIQHYWDWDLTVEDIETVIEYFKNLKQLIKLERKVNKLAIYG